MSRTRILQETHSLPCKLTPAEYEERTRSLVDAMADLDAHTEAEAEAKAALKAERARLETESERAKAQTSLTEPVELPPMKVPPKDEPISADSKEGRALIAAAARSAGWRSVQTAHGLDFWRGEDLAVRWDEYDVKVYQINGVASVFDLVEDGAPASAVVEAIERVRAAMTEVPAPPAPTSSSPTADAFASVIVEAERLRVVEAIDSIEVAQALASRPSLQAGVRRALERVIEDLGLVDACARRDVSTAPRREVVAEEVRKILGRKRPPVSAGVRRVGEALLASLDVRAAA